MQRAVLRCPTLARRTFTTKSKLLNYANLKLTFFHKPNCGLCDVAKEVIDDVLSSTEFKNEKIVVFGVNINDAKNNKWWKMYCFDIPVLHLEDTTNAKPLVVIEHFFREDDLAEKIRLFK
ncbi:hypothetical protein KAFR_0E01460 [Kazachstania africana CBS 2517]|uniref:Glutaredoxin-like protein n=1 Tax=Kazachstania africana (strain ATCC 22294 / BCRC 22015 / CBS 2517 / CECT 1963 / NBRC 1671 / NRRL Y-8276) TaxID=1071382 RepID=H2AVA0_KAZAF|nr:hypothetical protein KAFR_0E01460 [Kazachstania africana CBS 2517]CCF58300.1 hypothetical protein KAFR_0E01460 [Kazachstania africana CBS 2517]